MLDAELADEEEGLGRVGSCCFGKKFIANAALRLLLVCLIAHSQQFQRDSYAVLVGDVGKGIVFGGNGGLGFGFTGVFLAAFLHI
jgi:hypothetical protein